MITEQDRARTATNRAVPSARVDGLVTTETEHEVLVYDQRQHHIHHLNRTTAVVWRLCDGTRDVDALARLATAKLGAPVDAMLVRIAVSKLSDAELLSQPVAREMRVAAQSRRTFIRNATVAGAVAVPALISMTAPVMAAGSVLACGKACSNAGDCTGQNYNNTCNNCWYMDCDGNAVNQSSTPNTNPGIQPACICPQGQQGPNCPYQLTCPPASACPPGSTCGPKTAGVNQQAPMNKPLTQMSTQNQMAPTDTPSPEPTQTPVQESTQPPAPQATQPPAPVETQAPVEQPTSPPPPPPVEVPTDTPVPPPPPPPAAPVSNAPIGGNPNTAPATDVPNLFGNGNSGNNGNGGG